MMRYTIELTSPFYSRPKYDCGDYGRGWIGGKADRNIFTDRETAERRAATTCYVGGWTPTVVEVR